MKMNRLQDQIEAANQIARTAARQVAHEYGIGDQPGSVKTLAYHNHGHTVDVMRGSVGMAQALGMSALGIALTNMRASAHDVKQLLPRGVMEQESATWLQVAMEATGVFSDKQIAESEDGVLVTDLVVRDGKIIGQRVAHVDYKSLEGEQSALSVASGDFSRAWTASGPRLGYELYQEYAGVALHEDPGIEGLAAATRMSLELTEAYRFPHAIGEALFAGQRREVAQYHEHMLHSLEQGDITTFEQAMTAARHFERIHG